MANGNGLTFPEPGLYPGVPFIEYVRWPFLSNTTVKAGRDSMAHLKATLDGERWKVPTDDMTIGSALHTCFLEPEQMPDKVVVWNDGARRGHAWEEFQEEHKGKYILTSGFYQSLCGMVQSLRKHPVVKEWLGRIVYTECSAIGKVCGVPFKGRCDALTADPLIDLKKVRAADSRTITNTVLTFGYHYQAYLYRTLFDRDQFVILAVEDSPPYDVVAYELSPGFIRLAEREIKDILQRYLTAKETNHWPGRCDQIVQLEQPSWLTSEEEEYAGITFDST